MYSLNFISEKNFFVYRHLSNFYHLFGRILFSLKCITKDKYVFQGFVLFEDLYLSCLFFIRTTDICEICVRGSARYRASRYLCAEHCPL